MAQSSILGGSPVPQHARGTGTDLLGPSDSSDTGSDIQGERPLGTSAEDGGAGAIPADLDSDTDAAGTGERASSDGFDAPDGADISPDRVVRASSDSMDALDALDDADSLDDVEDLAVDDSTGEDEGDDRSARRGARH